MLNCKEVSRIVASDELASSSALKRMRVHMHLFICRKCRKYADQIQAINRVAKERFRGFVTDGETLERLEKEILDDAFGAPEKR